MKRHHSVRLVLLATLALGSGCKGVGGGADAMAVIPKDASIVFSMNLDRLRGSTVWPVVQEARNDQHDAGVGDPAAARAFPRSGCHVRPPCVRGRAVASPMPRSDA